jgi:hypothetical protein
MNVISMSSECFRNKAFGRWLLQDITNLQASPSRKFQSLTA